MGKSKEQNLTGVFDNREMMRREAWRDGQLAGRWPAAMCTDTRQTLTRWERKILEQPWGFYPDLPSPKTAGNSA